MKHVILGGSGFLGLEIVRQLSKKVGGDKIAVIDVAKNLVAEKYFLKHGIHSYRRDISRLGAFSCINLEEDDVVHHLASRLILANKPRFKRYNYFAKTTIDGTAAVLNWMKSNRCRHLVFWSTDMVYGYPKVVPVIETIEPRPLGPYGKTKLLAEEMVLKSGRDFGLEATIFRPRLIIGPGRLGILEKLFRLAEKNWPVPMIGDGRNTFQFVGVDDCAKASILAAERACGTGIFNLGSDDPFTVKDLLTGFLREVGSRSRILSTPAIAAKSVLECLNLIKISPMDQEQFRIADKSAFVSNKKAKNEFGWIPVRDDLSMLIEAYESYQNGKKLKLHDSHL